jgi:hypothetical protein
MRDLPTGAGLVHRAVGLEGVSAAEDGGVSG